MVDMPWTPDLDNWPPVLPAESLSYISRSKKAYNADFLGAPFLSPSQAPQCRSLSSHPRETLEIQLPPTTHLTLSKIFTSCFCLLFHSLTLWIYVFFSILLLVFWQGRGKHICSFKNKSLFLHLCLRETEYLIYLSTAILELDRGDCSCFNARVENKKAL